MSDTTVLIFGLQADYLRLFKDYETRSRFQGFQGFQGFPFFTCGDVAA